MKQLAISALRLAGHIALSPIEKWHLYTAKPWTAPPPVFIIGAPRSGTSLLYELMITRFRLAYMANAAHRFYLTPVAASRVFNRAIKNWRGNFTSRYGHIDGWGAPNEGGWIWQRWLLDGPWRDDKGALIDDYRDMRDMVAALSELFDAPIVNKNVMHSNRLKLMHAIWPNALFIEVKRDTKDNIRSIVRAERGDGGPNMAQDIWWSVKPRLAEKFIGKSDVERATVQVVGIERDIKRDIAAIGAHRLFTIEYSDLCQRPEAKLADIAAFLTQGGCEIKLRTDVPEFFCHKPSKPLEQSEEDVISDTLKNLGLRHQ